MKPVLLGDKVPTLISTWFLEFFPLFVRNNSLRYETSLIAICEGLYNGHQCVLKTSDNLAQYQSQYSETSLERQPGTGVGIREGLVPQVQLCRYYIFGFFWCVFPLIRV